MLEIKTDDGKGIRARAIVGNTSRCGVCDMILLDGQQFFMLDDPYNCVVHNTCLNFMQWDGKLRAQGTDKDEQSKQMSDDEQVLGEYMRKAHWTTLKIPTVVREAWVRFYFLGLMIRQSYTPEIRRDGLMRRVATALKLVSSPLAVPAPAAAAEESAPEATPQAQTQASQTTTQTSQPQASHSQSPTSQGTAQADAGTFAGAPRADAASDAPAAADTASEGGNGGVFAP